MNAPAQISQPSATATDEWQLRVDLAAAFRLAVHFDWHEGVANHFSLAVSPDGRKFLMNPKWVHFSHIRASDLLLIDADDPETMNRPDAPEITAWVIHGALHAQAPQARCALHLHPVHATALAGLADPVILPIDQNTARFHNRVAYDLGFTGMADSMDEGNRLVQALGGHSTMLMGNHGVLTAGATVAEAFDTMYYLERATRTLMVAYASGQPLAVMSEAVAEQTARDWEAYPEMAGAHFAEMKRMLDRIDPSYAD